MMDMESVEYMCPKCGHTETSSRGLFHPCCRCKAHNKFVMMEYACDVRLHKKEEKREREIRRVVRDEIRRCCKPRRRWFGWFMKD